MFEDIKKQIKVMLSQEKYEHSLSVAETAAKLAKKYGCDEQKAYFAGLIHDSAKCLSFDEQISICEKNGLILSDEDRASKGVLHAKAGVYVVKDKFGVDDEDVLSAISYHTTGKANMSIIEKIIYLADGIEPLRDFEGVDEIREKAEKSLDKAVLCQMNQTIISLIDRNFSIDITTIKARNYLLK